MTYFDIISPAISKLIRHLLFFLIHPINPLNILHLTFKLTPNSCIVILINHCIKDWDLMLSEKVVVE